ncbi:MAG: FMN-binding protein [Spirochaetales bacterium]|nr:FMN-binding protein [Spirochaetales bacterium]MCF7938721.1 FMN-binding protein [Spirochaetales bacterium]
MNKQSILYTVVFTFVVGFLFVLLLSLTHERTREMVERNQELSRRRALLSALDISYSSEAEVSEKYNTEIEPFERDQTQLYRYQSDSGTAVAKPFSGSGLWGTIRGYIAVSRDLDRIVGLEIVSQNETPGLGARIDEAWFKNQFRGEKIGQGGIRVGAGGEGDQDADNAEVDGVTGATRTSDSIETIINSEINKLENLLEAAQ